MSDTHREERHQAIQDGVDAAQKTDAAVDAAADTAAEKVEKIVDDAAEKIADEVETVQEKVADEVEKAADATPGADPAVDADAIEARVWSKLEARLTGLTAPAQETVAEAADGAETVADASLETTGDVARDVARPSQEHFWYRKRSLPGLRGRKS